MGGQNIMQVIAIVRGTNTHPGAPTVPPIFRSMPALLLACRYLSSKGKSRSSKQSMRGSLTSLGSCKSLNQR